MAVFDLMTEAKMTSKTYTRPHGTIIFVLTAVGTSNYRQLFDLRFSRSVGCNNFQTFRRNILPESLSGKWRYFVTPKRDGFSTEPQLLTPFCRRQASRKVFSSSMPRVQQPPSLVRPTSETTRNLLIITIIYTHERNILRRYSVSVN